MFQLSLFSSYIPYVTIAVMYVLYLGVYSYSRIHDDTEPVHVDEMQEKVISWQPESSAPKILDQCELFFADDSPAEVSAELNYLPVFTGILSHTEPLDEKHTARCFCFNLFSRPPPQLS